MEKTLQKLTDNKLVEQKQVKDFEELLKKSETKSNVIYLYFRLNLRAAYKFVSKSKSDRILNQGT